MAGLWPCACFARASRLPNWAVGGTLPALGMLSAGKTRKRGSYPRSPSIFWPGAVRYGSLSGMGNLTTDTALDGLLDPLSRCLDAESARRVMELRIDPAVQSRIDTLAERANDGALSEEERAEYEAYINASDFIAILKLKARRHLDSIPT